MRRPSHNHFKAETTPLWRVVYEDADLLVVDKPAGLLTSTVPRERRPTLLAAVREYIAANQPRARVGLIHRLDRDAAGLLVFTKSSPAFQHLKRQFYFHTVTRVYTAMIHGTLHPPQGTIRSRLVERADGTVYSTHRAGAGQEAITDYQLISTSGNRSVVQVTLQTGRKHQIRVHFSERGTPIIGDVMYGKPDAAGLHLAATMLEFDHPRKNKRLTFQLPPPPWLR